MQRRLLAGLKATAVLLGLAAVPALLTRFGGVPSPASIRLAVSLRWVSPHLALQLAGVVAWAAYAYLLAWIAIEVVGTLKNRPARTGPPTWLRPFATRVAALMLLTVGRSVAPLASPSSPPLVSAVATVHMDLAADPVPAAGGATRIRHVVVSGDNLWDLAEDYYGTGSRWRAIWDANIAEVPDPRDIRPGLILIIPSPGPDAGDDHTYTVQPGDSLWSIAQERLDSGAEWPELWHANADRAEPGGVLDDPSLLRPGWKLEIPAAEGATAAAAASQLSPAPVPTPEVSPAPTDTAPPAPPPSTTPAVGHQSATTAEDPHPRSDGGMIAEEAAAISAAAFSTAAMWWGVRRRRQRSRQRLTPGRLPTPPRPEVVAAEMAATSTAGAHVERVDLALRQLRVLLARRRGGADAPVVTAVAVGTSGLDVVMASAGEPPAGWTSVSERVWSLPATVEVAIPEAEKRGPAPCPCLVTLGSIGDRVVMLNLEGVGSLQLKGDSSKRRALATRWATELALAPYSAAVNLLCLGCGELPDVPMRLNVATEATDLSDWAASARGWGDAAQKESALPLAAGRLVGLIGDPIVVALDPDGLADLTPGPGLVPVSPTAGGLVLDLDAGTVDIDGLGIVSIEGAASTEVDLVVASDRMAEGDEGVVLGEPGAERYEPTFGALAAHVEANPGEAASSRVRVLLLGPAEVTGVGPAPRSQVLAIVAALALHKEGMSRSKLIDAAWREAPSEATVGKRISEARAWLGDPRSVIADADWVRLGETINCDWWEFERLARTPFTRSRALQLVRGRPLDGVLEDWDEREFLVGGIETRILETALSAAEEALAAGRHNDALSATDRGAQLNPYDERVLRVRMRAFAAVGDMGGVRQAFTDAEHLQMDDDQLEDETVELYEELNREARRRDRRPGSG